MENWHIFEKTQLEQKCVYLRYLITGDGKYDEHINVGKNSKDNCRQMSKVITGKLNLQLKTML